MRNLKKILFVILCIVSTGNFDAQNGYPKNTFTVGKNTFLLNGQPFIIKAAEMHYPRIPKEYWEQRILSAKAMGMNTICLYIFWNYHEQQEGKFDFSGQKDIAQFCRLAQKHGLYVIVRPGPYVCAEWEMGGLPWWLLKKKDIRLRDLDPYFIERTRIFMNEVGKKLARLQITRGGNILMVQVENEYGSYGINKPYIEKIREIVRNAGFTDVPLFQCDWSSNFTDNALDDLLWTVNFGTGANIDDQFKKLKELRPETPLMCSEFWSGWFDHWGAKHETRSAKDLVDGMKNMLDRNISFSLYMTHGGTSFSHWAGANFPNFSPTCTSYDYDAPIGEAGNLTPKYFDVRNLLQNYLPKGTTLAEPPAEIPRITLSKFYLNESAPLFDNLPQPTFSENIQPMEFFDQGWGSILYRTKLSASVEKQTLIINEAHDFTQVFIDGKPIATLSRMKGEDRLEIPPVKEGAILDILVEAMGRMNFGKGIYDWKGITDKVEVQTTKELKTLKNWQVYTFPADYDFSKNKNFISGKIPAKAPAYYRGTFNVSKVGDTFLDMGKWSKGLVWVNGHGLGRFWEIGPQQTLYLPGCWLKEGLNEIIVFDISGTTTPEIQGLDSPVLDKISGNEAYASRQLGEALNLSDEKAVYEGRFANKKGWQKINFGKEIEGQYFCLEANTSYNNDDYAAIAELEITDQNGKKIPRDRWRIVYADSEELNAANNIASNVFDMQESTFWHTNYSTSKNKPPHYIVIDMGKPYNVSGFEYLPRAETKSSGMVHDFKVFLKKTAFRIDGRP